MKKYIIFLLCLLIILSLFSCDLNKDHNAPSQNENTDFDSVDGDHTSAQISDNKTAMQVYPITAEQAWNLANAYWDNQDGIRDHAAGTTFTAKIVLINTPNSDSNYYRFAFQVERTSNVSEDDESKVPYHVNSHDEILVNAFTGEITASTYDPNGKGVSVEEAIEIAKNHRTYMSGHICNEENGYRVEHVPHATAPAHYYVIMIQKYDTVTDVIWIDKYTGKAISPYYMYGKG